MKRYFGSTSWVELLSIVNKYKMTKNLYNPHIAKSGLYNAPKPYCPTPVYLASKPRFNGADLQNVSGRVICQTCKKSLKLIFDFWTVWRGREGSDTGL